jgi:hypothetical protein
VVWPGAVPDLPGLLDEPELEGRPALEPPAPVDEPEPEPEEETVGDGATPDEVEVPAVPREAERPRVAPPAPVGRWAFVLDAWLAPPWCRAGATSERWDARPAAAEARDGVGPLLAAADGVKLPLPPDPGRMRPGIDPNPITPAASAASQVASSSPPSAIANLTARLRPLPGATNTGAASAASGSARRSSASICTGASATSIAAASPAVISLIVTSFIVKSV